MPGSLFAFELRRGSVRSEGSQTWNVWIQTEF
jgi:hypothetical protein